MFHTTITLPYSYNLIVRMKFRFNRFNLQHLEKKMTLDRTEKRRLAGYIIKAIQSVEAR